MKQHDFTLPCLVTFYPREGPNWSVNQYPQNYALEWLPAGLLVQIANEPVHSGESNRAGFHYQARYVIYTWEELLKYVIIVDYHTL